MSIQSYGTATPRIGKTMGGTRPPKAPKAPRPPLPKKPKGLINK